MDVTVPDEEIRTTVQRMEQNLAKEKDSLAEQLLNAYWGLKPRFFADLANEREALLCCGGALMLIQEYVKTSTTRRLGGGSRQFGASE
jgi:hypothetical protein